MVYLVLTESVLVCVSLVLVSLLAQSLLQQLSAVLHPAEQLCSRTFKVSLSADFNVFLHVNPQPALLSKSISKH